MLKEKEAVIRIVVMETEACCPPRTATLAKNIIRDATNTVVEAGNGERVPKEAKDVDVILSVATKRGKPAIRCFAYRLLPGGTAQRCARDITVASASEVLDFLRWAIDNKEPKQKARTKSPATV
ncbi:MAG: hypothetical protein WC385_02135 [Candidatus Paceibacterota bacterium]|jgi:hypothetical protein